MRYHLLPHPDFPFAAVKDVTVEASRPAPGRLQVRYVVTGNIAAIALPALDTPSREDELWRHSCFEAFVRAGAGPDYYEINIAPTYAWAAYKLESYRSALVNADIDTPHVVVEAHADHYEMHVTVDGLPKDHDWHLNIPVVLEEKDGLKSFWALAHNTGKPDFHHADVFLCKLKAPQ